MQMINFQFGLFQTSEGNVQTKNIPFLLLRTNKKNVDGTYLFTYYFNFI